MSLRSLAGLVAASRPRTALIVAALLVSLIETGATLWYPLITRDLIDSLNVGGVEAGAILEDRRLWLLLGILAAGAAAGGVSTYLLSRAGLAMQATLERRLVAALLAKPVPYFDARESGEHVSRVTKDSALVSSLLTEQVRGLVTGVLLLLGSIVVLTSLDRALTIVVFAIVIGAFAIMGPLFLAMAAITRRKNNSLARLSSLLTRIFSEIRLVKAYTAERAERARSAAAIEEVYSAGLRAAWLQAFLTPITSLALTLALLSIFTYGGARVALGTLSVGTLTAFILYVFNIVAPLIQLSAFVTRLQEARGASGPLHAILAGEPDRAAADRAAPAPIHREAKDICFENVALDYGGAGRPAVEIGKLVFAAGSSTALIGPSGAGKTSIISLIERFYEPTRGAIFHGDRPIHDLPVAQWRSMIGYVAQSPALLAGTIAENIGYGLAEAPPADRLREAAAAANCLDFIEALEDGFDAEVGESGVKLSGGQRQRIAIARIFMRDPAILLLDEATSNLDAESEEAVRSALRRLMAGRTTVTISHRRSTLRDVDFIAIVEHGRIADFGPRERILGESGYVARVADLLSE
ncbi:MAG: ABC transporter ATP-binding protein [Sphingomonadaceae bacterium]